MSGYRRSVQVRYCSRMGNAGYRPGVGWDARSTGPGTGTGTGTDTGRTRCKVQGARCESQEHKPGTHNTPCRRPCSPFWPWLGWLAEAEIKACSKGGETRCSPIRDGGNRRRNNWAAGHEHEHERDRAGQDRARHGKALDECDIGRDEPVVLCRVVLVSCLLCTQCIALQCSAVHCGRKHMHLDWGVRSPAAGEWMDSTGLVAAWKPIGGCTESSAIPKSRAKTCGSVAQVVWQFGTRKPKKGGLDQGHCKIVPTGDQGEGKKIKTQNNHLVRLRVPGLSSISGWANLGTEGGLYLSRRNGVAQVQRGNLQNLQHTRSSPAKTGRSWLGYLGPVKKQNLGTIVCGLRLG